MLKQQLWSYKYIASRFNILVNALSNKMDKKVESVKLIKTVCKIKI